MALSVAHLNKNIHGSPIFYDICLEAPDGCVTGLAGVNGSGKTMLMRAIAGLIRPDSGEVCVDGRTVGRDIDFPPNMGLLIENHALLNGRTGLDNLRTLASIRRVADEKRLYDVINFVGLEPSDRRHFSKYSLGMKQRLGLAAAIMERPRLLLLDEPTNALDAAGVQMLKKLVAGMRSSGATVILACHDAIVLRGLSDQIYHLAEGHLEGHETLQEARA